MKTKTILILLCLPLFGYSQNNSIDLMGSLDWTHRYLTTADGNGGSDSPLLNIRKDEMAKINWRFGLNYNRRIADKWFLRTGVRMASMGYQTGVRTLTLSETNASGEPEFTTVPVEWTFDYLFLEVPLLFRYEFNQKKWTPFVEGGISSSYYIKTREVEVLDGEKTIRQADQAATNFNRYQFVGILALGINYNITTDWQLFGQSTFRAHLSQLADTIFNEYLYGIGLEIGVRRNF